MADQKAIYDDHYGRRASLTAEQVAHPLFGAFYDRLAERVLAAAPARPAGDPIRFLEVACGEGLLAAALTRSGAPLDYLGTDLSESALPLTSRVMPAGGELIVGDAVDVVAGLPEASRDLVVVKNLLHHLDDPTALMAAVRRVLAPGGRVVVAEATMTAPAIWVFTLTAPAREKLWFKGTRRSRRALLDAGLRIVNTGRFSWLPYELAFAVRFPHARRRFGSADPAWLDKVARFDDRMTDRLPWMATYVLWTCEA